MPLLANSTDGALSRKRLEAFVARSEGVTTVAATDAATVATAANLAANQVTLYTMTPTANRTLTTPTGADIAAALTDETVGTSFEIVIVNLAASTYTVTLTAGASGVTIVGNAVVAAASSGTFMAVFTAAGVLSIYRK
jgi:hypothetical protein